jgi:putative ABC transport system ATP-binding protein
LLLTAERVSRVYRAGSPHAVHALSDVSLGVPGGEITLIRGPSGSGKTTLLCILGTLLRPSSGRVLLDGLDLSGASDAERTRVRRHRMGFLFQGLHLIPGLAAWANVAYPLVPYVPSEAERRERAMALLRELRLEERAGHAPEEMSGGEQQRVALARALVAGPDVLLADEPTSSMDEESIENLLGILARLCEGGMTIVVVSHDPRLLPHAGRVLALEKGRLAES